MRDNIPNWLRSVLILSGIYNLLWGAWTVIFPDHFFNLINLPLPRYPQLWQCIGMIVGVYGIGYLIASRDPFRHWPIIFVGFLGKVFGPLGFLMSFIEGKLPLKFASILLTNDFVWLIPFAYLLLLKYRHYRTGGALYV